MGNLSTHIKLAYNGAQREIQLGLRKPSKPAAPFTTPTLAERGPAPKDTPILPSLGADPSPRELPSFGISPEQWKGMTAAQRTEAVPGISKRLKRTGIHPFLAKLLEKPGMGVTGVGAGLGGIIGALLSRNRGMGALGGSLVGGGLAYMFRDKLIPYLQQWLAGRTLPGLARTGGGWPTGEAALGDLGSKIDWRGVPQYIRDPVASFSNP